MRKKNCAVYASNDFFEFKENRLSVDCLFFILIQNKKLNVFLMLEL